MLERMELSIQKHYFMCTLKSILHTVQRLIYSRGAVVIVRELAQLVRNSLYGVQPNCGVPSHPRIQKRNAYSASLQTRSEGPHSTQRERASSRAILGDLIESRVSVSLN